jgi:hypothetical protein
MLTRSTLFDGDEDGELLEQYSHVEGQVVENVDPERQQRIKVLIPSIDTERPWPRWVRRLGGAVGPPGYGDFHVPAVGVEVFLVSRLGQGHNWFYLPVFNTRHVVPPEFADPAHWGIRAPGDYSIICEGDLFLSAGRVIIESKSSIRLTAKGGVFINGREY